MYQCQYRESMYSGLPGDSQGSSKPGFHTLGRYYRGLYFD